MPKQKYRNISEDDLQEARELYELMSLLKKEEKMQATVYIRALADRNMFAKGMA